MNKKLWIFLIAAFALILAVWYFTGSDTSTAQSIKVPVKYGMFTIDVSTTGELEAKRSENIIGPQNLRSIQIWGEIMINQLVPEGTIVDSGDFVASLDQTEVMSKLQDLENELEKLESQYTKTMLDTSLNMRASRNELVNLKFNLEEMQITVDQSVFEPPAVQRQAAINLEKSQRAYDQAVENYVLRDEKAKAEMQEVTATLEQAKRRKERMLDILKQFTVYAPKPGMVIYRRDWRGRKTETGSSVSSWDNVVAMLPDLSKMITKTYVNEIDISKVRVGQPVKVSIDAFPDQEYQGEVSEVANIGEQRPGSDAKVFEVVIDVLETDTIMRPAMTTKNMIITAQIDSVLFIPIEALHSNDTMSYVFTDVGARTIKKQVVAGQSNNNEIIILEGLNQNDQVHLTIPDNHADLKIQQLND
jgi:HlyD family secretion protein